MDTIAFINSVKGQAQTEYKNNGILASVTIAQAILESAWGESQLTKQGNNLFGIKIGSGWQGETIVFQTREQKPDGTPYTINVIFRKYLS